MYKNAQVKMITIIMQKSTFVLASLTMCSQQMMHLNGRFTGMDFSLYRVLSNLKTKVFKYLRYTVAHKGHAVK